MYQALYRKWRPKTFDDVVGQSHITETIRRQVAAGRTSHAYLFTGTRGTGKTTCAKILAKAVNCEHPVEGNPCCQCPACRGIEDGSILDVVELDAASNNGVDQVRALRDEAVFAPTAVKKRVYIVDEVHMLSVAAFNALLKILEEPPEHLMFILATTELHKVPATILSRCQRFSFKRIQSADIAMRLAYVAEQEGIGLTREASALLARLADGGLRDALSLLDQCAASGAQVDKEAVLDTLGLAGNLKTAHMLNDVRKGDTGAALEALAELYANGKDISAVLDELAALVRDLLVRKTAPEGTNLMAGGYDEATLQALERGFSVQRLLYLLTLLQAALSDLKNSANRRTDAELCLIRMCDGRLEDSPQALSERIARLEAALAAGATVAPIPESREREAEPALPPLEEEPPAPLREEREAVMPVPEERLAGPAPLPVEPPLEEPLPPAPEPEPAPPKEPVQAAFTGDGDRFWLELVPELRSVVGPAAYPFLSNAAMSVGCLSGNTLTVYARDEFSRRMLNKPKVLDGIARAASARAGGAVQVKLALGAAPDTGGEAKPAPEQPRRRKKTAPRLEAEQREKASPPPTPGKPAPGADPLDEVVAFGQGKGKDITTILD